MPTAAPIRPPAVAGQFYPGSPDALRNEVDQLLARASETGLGERIVALVAPHAGYVYSGATAAAAYRQVQGQSFDAVIVIAPSHRDAFDGVSLMAKGGYATPLGALPVHREIAERLLKSGAGIRETTLGHGLEHAIEVQLPFIQRAIGEVPIVPLVMMDRSWTICRKLAHAIAEATQGMRVLAVASSDLYHGYSEAECQAIDEVTLEEAEKASPEEFCNDLASEQVQACGGGPIAVVKEFARRRGALGTRVLAHATSADATGHHGGYVVGYGAVVYYSEAGAGNAEAEATEAALSEADRALLLDLARKSIRAAVADQPAPDVPQDRPALLEPKGAFVTIRRQGELRGCIGQMQATKPLAETVILMACSAAQHDPRFESMVPEELEDSTLEISVLSPLRKIASPDEVVVGTHGILVSGRGRRGVLLPQVPVEQGWGREAFLDHVCMKAGLPLSAWHDEDITLEVFTAEVFGDDRPIGLCP